MAINQCDGCRRRLPLQGGSHIGRGYDRIGCTSHLYGCVPYVGASVEPLDPGVEWAKELVQKVGKFLTR